MRVARVTDPADCLQGLMRERFTALPEGPEFSILPFRPSVWVMFVTLVPELIEPVAWL